MKDVLRYSGIVEGVIAVALIAATGVLLDIPASRWLLAAAGSATTLVYLVDRLIGAKREDVRHHPERVLWIQKHCTLLTFVLLPLGATVVATLVMLQPETQIIAALLAFATVVHLFPLLPGHRRLRAFTALKPVVIAGAWAAGSVLLPVVEAGRSIDVAVVCLSFYRLGFILPNTLLSDVLEPQTTPGRTPESGSGKTRDMTRAAVAVAVLAMTWGGLMLANGLATKWLQADLIGPGLYLVIVARKEWQQSPAARHLVDLVTAWPLVWLGLKGLSA